MKNILIFNIHLRENTLWCHWFLSLLLLFHSCLVDCSSFLLPELVISSLACLQSSFSETICFPLKFYERNCILLCAGGNVDIFTLCSRAHHCRFWHHFPRMEFPPHPSLCNDTTLCKSSYSCSQNDCYPRIHSYVSVPL